MIDWEKYFDHIYCICNISTNKFDKIKNELKRVGILDSNIFSWKITTNLLLDHITYDLTYKKEEYNTQLIKNKSIDLIKANLDIFTEAKLLKYNKILIIEDDACFLKDINEIKKILENLPNDYDICHFDWIYPYIDDNNINNIIDIENRIKKSTINKYFIYSEGSYITTCNAYSRQMIEYIINNINEYFNNKICMPIDDFLLYIIYSYQIQISDDYEYIYNKNLIKYNIIIKNIISINRLCIQSFNKNSLNSNLGHNNFYIDDYNTLQNILNKNFNFNNYNL